MTREQALDFINSMKVLTPYVPPMHWAPVANHPVLQMVLAVANGHATCALTLVSDAAKAAVIAEPNKSIAAPVKGKKRSQH